METENITKPTNQFTEKYQLFQNRARETAKNMSDTTDTFVHENPWWSLGLVALSALCLGLILGATTRRD